MEPGEPGGLARDGNGNVFLRCELVRLEKMKATTRTKQKAAAPMRLEIVGHKGYSPEPKNRRMKQIKDLFEGLKDGQAMLTRDVASHLGMRVSSFQSIYAREPCFERFRCKVAISTIWANARTIEAIKNGELEI